ncbi:MAG: aspartate 1-decarboxylase [Rhodocyclaceae bacterium]|nr:aspartate 1-decarboxylase [Rhodocyclaceae bacterium]
MQPFFSNTKAGSVTKLYQRRLRARRSSQLVRTDLVIIAVFGQFNEAEVEQHQPKLVFVDEHNRVTHTRGHVPVQKVA